MSQTNYTKKFKKLVKGTTMLSAAIAVMATQNTANAQELPPADAKAGECYAKVIPATFETVSEQVLVSPARVEWKKGRGPFEKIDAATGEIMCRVEIPAEYTTVEKTVLKTPPQTTEEVIPAEYELREKRVMKTPPTAQKKVIPAKYETITIREMVKPASYQQIAIPAKTQVIEKRQLVSKEVVQWREILCETNTTPNVVQEIQERLVNAGYGLGGNTLYENIE